MAHTRRAAALSCWFGRFGRIEWLLLLHSVVLGLLFFGICRDWFQGVMAALCVWVVAGLWSESGDLRRCQPARDVPAEIRWGWRFAIAWRVAIIGLIGMYFVVQLLALAGVVGSLKLAERVWMTSQELWEAVLFLALLMTLGSTLRREESRPSYKSWSTRLLAYLLLVVSCLAAAVFCAFLLKAEADVPALVHLTLVGIGLAQPLGLQCPAEAFGSCDPNRLLSFHYLSASAVLAVFESYALLRLLLVFWKKGPRLRIMLGVLFAWSLAVSILLVANIYFVQLPVFSPIIAHNAKLPLEQLLPAFLATLIVVTAVAARWSATPWHPVHDKVQGQRSDRRTYYHGSRILALLLALATLVEWVCRVDAYAWTCFHHSKDFWAALGDFVYTLFTPYHLFRFGGRPVFLALIVVALAVAFRRRTVAGDSELVPCLPGVAPGRFLFAWAASLILVVCAAMAITTWGSTIIFNIQPRYWYYWLVFPCAVSLIVAAVAIVDDLSRTKPSGGQESGNN